MSKRQWLCVLGAWVIIFLFLGFPAVWHKAMAVVSGIIIIAIAYNLPQEQKINSTPNDSTFVESKNKENVQ